MHFPKILSLNEGCPIVQWWCIAITSLSTLLSKSIVCVQIYVSSQQPLSMFWRRGVWRDKGEGEQQNFCVPILESLDANCIAPAGRKRISLAAVWGGSQLTLHGEAHVARSTHRIGSACSWQSSWSFIPCRACLTPIKGFLMLATFHPSLLIPSLS